MYEYGCFPVWSWMFRVCSDKHVASVPGGLGVLQMARVPRFSGQREPHHLLAASLAWPAFRPAAGRLPALPRLPAFSTALLLYVSCSLACSSLLVTCFCASCSPACYLLLRLLLSYLCACCSLACSSPACFLPFACTSPALSLVCLSLAFSLTRLLHLVRPTFLRHFLFFLFHDNTFRSLFAQLLY